MMRREFVKADRSEETYEIFPSQIIAPEIQFVQVFSAAMVAGSREIEGSKRLIEFLTSARAFEAIRNSGMEPLADSGEADAR